MGFINKHIVKFSYISSYFCDIENGVNFPQNTFTFPYGNN